MRILDAVRPTAAAAAALGAFAMGPGTANALVMTTNCVAADRCTLDDLFNNNGAIQVNDKLFGMWELELLDFTAAASPDLALIDVLGLDDGGSDPGPGIRFEGNDQLSVADSDFLDLRFTFHVWVLRPDLEIVDNSLVIPDFGGSDDAFITIDEAVFDSPGGVNLGNKHVEVDFLFFNPSDLFDEIEFNDAGKLRHIFIEKDIFLDAGFGGAANLIAFEQRFSQAPEPATLTLFGVGLAGLGVAGWRRRKRV